MLKVLSLFSGIGAFEKALSRQQIEYELVNYCEIDKYASKAYSVIHNEPESKNLGDITQIDENKLPDFDLMTWGFPCTDISVAGHQKGIIQGATRSGLYYEGLRILRAKLPKYSIIENVKALTGNKFKEQFQQMLSDIKNCGYRNHWKVLNAKDYGIPQSRDRVFIVSIRDDVECSLEWPQLFDNGLRLRDILEPSVDKKYYISEDKTQKLLRALREDYGNKDITVPCITPDRIEKRQNGRRFKNDGEPMFTLNTQDKHGILQVGMLEMKGNELVRRVYDPSGLSPTLNTMQGGNRQPKIVVTDNDPVFVGGIQTGEMWLDDGKQLSRNYRQGNRIWDSDGVAVSIVSNGGGLGGCSSLYKIGYRIRKLTPLECWRLMGFDDEDFNKCKAAKISDSQLYKMAGNSIVVNVLEAILYNLLDKSK